MQKLWVLCILQNSPVVKAVLWVIFVSKLRRNNI